MGAAHSGPRPHPQICLETRDEFAHVTPVRRVNGYELGLETRGERRASLCRIDSLRLQRLPGFARSR
jgi:hypothetical protein